MKKKKIRSLRNKLILLTFSLVFSLQIVFTLVQYNQIQQAHFNAMANKASEYSVELVNSLNKRLSAIDSIEQKKKFVGVYAKLEGSSVIKRIIDNVKELNEIVFVDSDYKIVTQVARDTKIFDESQGLLGENASGLVFGQDVTTLAYDDNFIVVVPVKVGENISGYLIYYYSNTSLLTEEKDLLLTRFIFLIIFLLAGAIASVFFVYKITEPLDKLKKTVNNFGLGNFGERVEIGTHDEIGELGETFNQMADNLAMLEGQLVDKNKDLQNKVVELKESESRLEQELIFNRTILSSIGDGLIFYDKDGKIILVNKAFESLTGWSQDDVVGKDVIEVTQQKDEQGKLFTGGIFKKMALAHGGEKSSYIWYFSRKNQTTFPAASITDLVILNNEVIGMVEVFRDITKEKELDIAREEFVTMVSHQLRTPLSAIKWSLEIFQQKNEFTLEQKSQLSDIYKSNERLIKLVNNLLDVTNIETGKVHFDKKKINLFLVIKNLVENFELQAQRRRQKIVYSFPTGVGDIVTDLSLLELTLNNLLENAVNYSKEGTEIEVSVLKDDGDGFTLSVHNFGSYISEDSKEKIFSKFFRLPGSSEVYTAGSGLGLFLAKGAVEACGGKIWFESNQSSGTTFFFTLPNK